MGNAVIYLACYDTINALNDDADYQAYKPAAKIEPVAEVVNDVLNAFVDVLKQAADAIVNVFKHLGDALSNLFKGANWQRKCKRVAYLAKQAKKARVRKKNAKRIMRWNKQWNY